MTPGPTLNRTASTSLVSRESRSPVRMRSKNDGGQRRDVREDVALQVALDVAREADESQAHDERRAGPGRRDDRDVERAPGDDARPRRRPTTAGDRGSSAASAALQHLRGDGAEQLPDDEAERRRRRAPGGARHVPKDAGGTDVRFGFAAELECGGGERQARESRGDPPRHGRSGGVARGPTCPPACGFAPPRRIELRESPLFGTADRPQTLQSA